MRSRTPSLLNAHTLFTFARPMLASCLFRDCVRHLRSVLCRRSSVRARQEVGMGQGKTTRDKGAQSPRTGTAKARLLQEAKGPRVGRASRGLVQPARSPRVHAENSGLD